MIQALKYSSLERVACHCTRHCRGQVLCIYQTSWWAAITTLLLREAAAAAQQQQQQCQLS
jgi:hypothetical protein